jgi:hypothetical protein
MEVRNMDGQVYSFALKSTLNEIQKICPDIKNTFMFREDGNIVAGNENTSEQTIVSVIDAFDGILEKAEVVGGVESVAFEGSNGRVNVSSMNDLYLVTVTSRKADMNYVSTVSNDLIPTILKLLEKIDPTSIKNSKPRPEIEHEQSFQKMEKPSEEPAEEYLPSNLKRHLQPVEAKPEPFASEPPTSQFIVENIGGLLVPSDIVRIDNESLSQWAELYDGRGMEEVEVETFGGKSIQCKVRPLKDSKLEGKGIIQIPEKMQIVLEIKKGELVRVRPIVE